jgi:hypothetical protein
LSDVVRLGALLGVLLLFNAIDDVPGGTEDIKADPGDLSRFAECPILLWFPLVEFRFQFRDVLAEMV